MQLTSQILRYTTLPYDTTINGILYSSDDSIASIDPPKLSDNADREAFKIVFADPDMSFSGLCDEMMNSRVSVRGGFYNTTGDILVGSDNAVYEPNEPLLNITDTLLMYKGFIDSVRYAISEEDGVILEIECASPMASLDAVNSFYSTTNSLKQRVPASAWIAAPDTAFDNLSLGGKAQEVLWGKI